MSHVHRDATGARIGMWLFLFTELLLFGGLFLLYAVYRSTFPEDFHFAAASLDTTVGTVNTLILLASSLSMALAVQALSRGARRASTWLLMFTIGAGLLFLVNKYFEWAAKFSHGLYPNSPELLRHTPGENVFYGLYFMMTGLHGLHVLIGIGLLAVMLFWVSRRPRRTFSVPATDPSLQGWELPSEGDPREARITVIFDRNDEIREGLVIKLENSGLYWHLVDVIWIFLFPLFYLIS